MKKIYQIPETEIVLVGFSKLILQNEGGEQSGTIGNGDDGPGVLTNQNTHFEEEIPNKEESL